MGNIKKSAYMIKDQQKKYPVSILVKQKEFLVLFV